MLTLAAKVDRAKAVSDPNLSLKLKRSNVAQRWKYGPIMS